ncbi:MAG TPA: RNA-binding S4 domain-containing protein [Polyangiaceae bacterium]|nr:RNA-binding S4 domain-containing protein [Polyangiaceae bacterium]
MSSSESEQIRIDRWLCAARIYKSRTQAHDACEGGLVKINDESARASQAVRVGDEVRAHAPRGLVILKVLKLAPKRLGPQPARELYEDHSPPPPPREERIAVRERGAGRPTKADRRAMERLRTRDD